MQLTLDSLLQKSKNVSTYSENADTLKHETSQILDLDCSEGNPILSTSSISHPKNIVTYKRRRVSIQAKISLNSENNIDFSEVQNQNNTGLSSKNSEDLELKRDALEESIPVKKDFPASSKCDQKGLKYKENLKQYHLDFGQRDFFHTTCKTCGLTYATGLLEDEKLHTSFHAKYIGGIAFKGWKSERILSYLDEKLSRIILILPEDPSSHLNKVNEIGNFLESELGLHKGWLFKSKCKVFLYISSSKKVIGCVFAERVDSAFLSIPSKTLKSMDAQESNRNSLQLRKCSIDRNVEEGEEDSKHKLEMNTVGKQVNSLVPNKVEELTHLKKAMDDCSAYESMNSTNNSQLSIDLLSLKNGDKSQKDVLKDSMEAHDSLDRSLEGIEQDQKDSSSSMGDHLHSKNLQTESLNLTEASFPVVCGIRAMWVHKEERRRGIASKLMDEIRSSFSYGCLLSVSQIAFSQPTKDGAEFAAKYCKNENILVYI